MSSSPRDIKITLVCRSLPATDEPVVVGIQDKEQNVREGSRKRDGSTEFTCVVQAREKAPGRLDFSGPFVHGTPASRFLYISWKRKAPSPAPWLQRVKVPLTLTPGDLKGVDEIQADVTGRRPHATEAVAWTFRRARQEAGRA